MAEVLEACAVRRELQRRLLHRLAGGRFDPSGYVKGWAIERAARILTTAGSASHLVNGGGDVQCVGGRPDAATSPAGVPPWRVGIADPLRPGRLALVVAAGTARSPRRGPPSAARTS